MDIPPRRSDGRWGLVDITHLRFVDGLDTGHRGGNTRDGVLALALGAVLLGAGPGLLPLGTGGLLDVHGRAGEMRHELGAGDGLHVQGVPSFTYWTKFATFPMIRIFCPKKLNLSHL